MHYDLLIGNGRIVDGSGLPSYVADDGIKDRRITETAGLAATRPAKCCAGLHIKDKTQ